MLATLYTPESPTVISTTAYTYENTRYVHHANQIRRKKIVLLMYQMTEPYTKITKHG